MNEAAVADPWQSRPVPRFAPVPFLPLRDHLPTRTVPFINYALIAANVAVFLWEEAQIAGGVDPDVLDHALGLVPVRLIADPVHGLETTFTSMFMHAGLGHIAGNMLFLWIFGDNVEDALGHLRYLTFYLLGGACAAAAQTAASLGDPVAMRLPLVGASGAIAAVLAAYAFLYPLSPITVLNPVFFLWFVFGLFLDFPAWLVIALWFLGNLWDAFANTQHGGVAFMAHVGGFVGGALLLPLFMANRPRLDDYARWRQWAARRRRSDAW
ncbi:MAG TPA: rhomboid family intramembrane serine protease [Polyangiaceae bacterium]|nr:rhomboid family intramembrane serine protease [Polyangiaceae bacterium]